MNFSYYLVIKKERFKYGCVLYSIMDLDKKLELSLLFPEIGEDLVRFHKAAVLSEAGDLYDSANRRRNFISNDAHETANDFVREHAINKGFTFSEYTKSAQLIKRHHLKLKTYVLIKPLFLTEKESLDDCINTINKIKSYTDSISFNPVNVQRNTVVEYFWKRKQFRPAWLWSVVEILKSSKQVMGTKRIQCDIAGGGSRRGAHNCITCDRPVLDAIADFSLTQDSHVFNDLECSCKEKWLDQLDLENLTFGSIVDFSRSNQ